MIGALAFFVGVGERGVALVGREALHDRLVVDGVDDRPPLILVRQVLLVQRFHLLLGGGHRIGDEVQARGVVGRHVLPVVHGAERGAHFVEVGLPGGRLPHVLQCHSVGEDQLPDGRQRVGGVAPQLGQFPDPDRVHVEEPLAHGLDVGAVGRVEPVCRVTAEIRAVRRNQHRSLRG
jgi:hypothetical protein